MSGISDHEAVFTCSSLAVDIPPSCKRKSYSWAKANWSQINEMAKSFCNSFITDYTVDTDINVLWSIFRDFCMLCLTYIPSKITGKNHDHPWISPFIKQLTRRKQRAYNRARLSHSTLDWSLYYSIKKECQRECRKAFNCYVSGLVDTNGNVSKKLWSFIKDKRTDHCGVASLEVNGTMYNKCEDKASVLNEYFTSVFTKEDISNIPTLDDYSFPDISPISITNAGVLALLSNLKIHKASGPDKIPASLLKNLATSLAPALTMIFKASLSQSSLPPEWKIANIVPIFKKGNRNNPGNYRPVSLTCICSKLLEHIVYSHIFSHLSKYNILTEEQHGFRQFRSCETQLIATIHDLAENLNNGKQTDIILLDFTKAFDKVPHGHLCSKLNQLGINGSLLSWIKCFLADRYQQVTINGESSSPALVTSGVPQGTVLAPLLFLCYINDITRDVSCKIKLYADDVLIYNTIASEVDCRNLQRDLNLLQDWAITWKMCFNPTKCEFLRLTNKRNIIKFQYFIQGNNIQEVHQVKYLGVTINNKLSWSDHTKIISSKANSVLGFLRRNFNQCPSKTKSALYLSLVRPILEYAVTVWAPYHRTDICQIEAIQRRAARFAMNCYDRHQSVTEMLRKLTWPTLESRRNHFKIIMMFKIVNDMIHIQPDVPIIYTTGSNTRGHHLKMQQPATRIDVYLHSFFPSTVKLWNLLPSNLIDSPSLDSFKCNLAKLN